MSDSNILSEIKKSEAEARKLEQKASVKKDKIILEARKTAQNMIDSAKEESVKLMKYNISGTRKKVDADATKNLNASKKDAEKLVSGANKNISKAVDFVVDEFTKKII